MKRDLRAWVPSFRNRLWIGHLDSIAKSVTRASIEAGASTEHVASGSHATDELDEPSSVEQARQQNTWEVKTETELYLITTISCPALSWTAWGGWMFALHLHYVVPLFSLFKRTHNYPVDDQGLLPCWLCCLGGSKVRLAYQVRALSAGKIF